MLGKVRLRPEARGSLFFWCRNTHLSPTHSTKLLPLAPPDDALDHRPMLRDSRLPPALTNELLLRASDTFRICEDRYFPWLNPCGAAAWGNMTVWWDSSSNSAWTRNQS